MENPQAQMQGQGQPQQQGQDQQMQQLMQAVQQMVQQGMQPVDIAAQLLQQVPPEAIMQVFVEMGIPQEEAQASIEQAMQGAQGQQPQGPGEEQIEGAASNPQEEAVEGAPLPENEEMAYGGGLPKRLVRRAEGGGNPEQEMQTVMSQVQEMMQGGADARQVMEQIQAAAQQGQISPEVAQAVMEQLSGQMQATDPQDPNAGANPQQVDPNMASPDSQMMAFGGNLKKLMTKALGGDAIPPSIDSKNYAQDRAAMITNAIKNNTFKSTLDSDFPSLAGNQMAYGGDLPKAANGAFNLADYKTADEAELAAYRHRQTLSPEEQAKFNVAETVKGWKAPEPTYEAGKNYQYDPATKGFKAVETTAQQQYVPSVGYPNPFGGGAYNNLYQGASPFARLMANSSVYGMPRVRGNNLPGGMDATAFMMQTAGQNLAPGMAGKANGQDYRVTGVEDIKGGLFGRKKVGVRYNIDWGNPASVANAPAGPQNAPSLSGPLVPPAASNNPATITLPPSGNSIPMGQNNINANAALAPGMENPITTSNGSNMMWDSGNMPTLQNPNNGAQPQQPAAPANTEVQGVTPVNNISWDSGNMPTLQNPNNGAGPETFPSLIPGRNEMVSKDAIDFQKSQADKGMVWNAATNSWISNEANALSAQLEAAKNTPAPPAPVVYDEPRYASKEDLMNIVNNPAPPYREYGGDIDSQALNNAVNLINRAFGGMIPYAANGMDLGSQDANGNGIPDYLEAANLPAQQQSSSVDITGKRKINVDWNAASDLGYQAGSQLVNIMQGANAINPQRDIARMSALNTQPTEYSDMKQGLYDQAGNFIPNDIGNQVLNPTDTYYSQNRQVFAFGGKVYEIGGDVELDDNELVALQQAGFKVQKY